MRTTIAVFVATVLLAVPAFAQETRFHADLRKEGNHIKESCSTFNAKALGGCAYTLVTDSPFHVALGSLAPQNGFAFGLAFAEHFTPNEAWRLSWNADLSATLSGSWRGGAYMKMVHTPATSGVVVRPPGAAAAPVRSIAPREFTVVDLFVQSISLEKINFFGPGASSARTDRSVFGEGQTLGGGSVIYPLGSVPGIGALRPALIGAVAVRSVDIRPGDTEDMPSIEQLYSDASAPGLSQQKAFVEVQEGIRFRPSLAGGRLQFNYRLSAQQFRTSEATRSSFNRWSLDLQHVIPLYRGVSSPGPQEFNGPNECSQALGTTECPRVSWSRNREGAVGFRLLVSAATTSDDNRVPFYFQPTLGGSDINGERLLAGYDDYRFRAPNLIALQESFEHAIWGPIGAFVQAEQGKVVLDKGDLSFGDLASSATVGVTLRAGGFPMVNLSFSWSSEGHHIIGAISPTLLGGSSRPSLF